MESILIGIHVLAAIAITGLVLMQQGKGADAGASFGGGASNTMFGSSGSGNFLTRSTTWITVVFFATSLSLAIVAKQKTQLSVQDSSLISGDLEQITRQQELERDQNAGEFPLVPSLDTLEELPAVNAESGDLPELNAVAEEASSLIDDAQTGLEAPANEAQVQ